MSFTQLVHQDGNVYAAKRFYDLGGPDQEPPSLNHNLRALQQELVVMTIARSICNSFIEFAKSKNVGIAGSSYLSFAFSLLMMLAI
jgi:hypothetical protein